MALRNRQEAIPEPYIVPATSLWDGNDGSWSTFHLSVGSPPQDFRVLISTRGHEMFVPVPEGCTIKDRNSCPSLRGAEPFAGSSSPGFQTNKSSTWDLIGLYNLGTEADLGYSGTGLYGYDNVRLGTSQDSTALALERQIVAGIADKDYYMGLIGLSTISSSFDSTSQPITSFFANLKGNNSIPSLSYAYTAGAPYRYKKVPGNLVLGGYDQARLSSPPRFNFTFSSDDSRSLLVGVQSIMTSSSLAGVAAMTKTGHLSLIDSTVPHLWLPQDVCDLFAENFGLTYDNNTDLYLINDTIREKLLGLGPELTFKLSNDEYTSGINSTNIVLPYAAFDLEVSAPYYSTPKRYFPIRRAANDSQFVLGRTLLQEAYLIVDQERRNFTIMQTKFSDPLPSPDIITILSPGTTPSETGTSGSSNGSLGASAVAGIAVAASIVGISTILVLVFLYWRRRYERRKRQQQYLRGEAASWEHGQQQNHQVEALPLESDTNEIAEMPAGGNAQELEADRDVVYELESLHVPVTVRDGRE